MSGVKNLSNAIANDPSFASKVDGLISKKEAAEFVPQGHTAKGQAHPGGAGKSSGKPPQFSKSSKGGY